MTGRMAQARVHESIRRILLLEDNMLIALDTEDVLRGAGVPDVVVVTNTVAALEAIEHERPDFGLLDFNLGHETSERVAEVLAQAGVPFCFATGYGSAMEELSLQPSFGVLMKPYSPEDLIALLDRVSRA